MHPFKWERLIIANSIQTQGNRFTCPIAYAKLPAPVPPSVTKGLVCYTGTPNAMPIGATASLGAFTPHNLTDYFNAEGASSCIRKVIYIMR